MKARKSKTAVTGNIAVRLRELAQREMEEKNLNKTQLAKNIGIERSALIKYMDDDVEIGVNALVKIAKYFDVSADFLLGLSKIQSPDHNDRSVYETTNLTPEAVKNYRKILKKLSYLNTEIFCYEHTMNFNTDYIAYKFLENPSFPDLILLMNDYMQKELKLHTKRNIFTNIVGEDSEESYFSPNSEEGEFALFRISEKVKAIAQDLVRQYEKEYQEDIDTLIDEETRDPMTKKHIAKKPPKKKNGEWNNG